MTMDKHGRLVSVDSRSNPSPHGPGTQLARVLWSIAWVFLFRPSPWFWHGWRRLVLRMFGARVGRGAKIMPTVRIWAPWNLEMGDHSVLGAWVDCYNAAPITLGSHATVSQYTFLCTATHDHESPTMRLVTRPICVGDQAWVCADVFVAPGVTIGQGAVVGARSAVFHDLPQWTICHGTPARPGRPRHVRDEAGAPGSDPGN
jgi:putative colanic acid biosynthesis acetyltransferase WcaF